MGWIEALDPLAGLLAAAFLLGGWLIRPSRWYRLAAALAVLWLSFLAAGGGSEDILGSMDGALAGAVVCGTAVSGAVVFRWPQFAALPLGFLFFMYVWTGGWLIAGMRPLPGGDVSWEGTALPAGEERVELLLVPAFGAGGEGLLLDGEAGEAPKGGLTVWKAHPWCFWLPADRWLEYPAEEPGAAEIGPIRREFWFRPVGGGAFRTLGIRLYSYLNYRMILTAAGDIRWESGYLWSSKEG